MVCCGFWYPGYQRYSLSPFYCCEWTFIFYKSVAVRASRWKAQIATTKCVTFLRCVRDFVASFFEASTLEKYWSFDKSFYQHSKIIIKRILYSIIMNPSGGHREPINFLVPIMSGIRVRFTRRFSLARRLLRNCETFAARESARGKPTSPRVGFRLPLNKPTSIPLLYMHYLINWKMDWSRLKISS